MAETLCLDAALTVEEVTTTVAPRRGKPQRQRRVLMLQIRDQDEALAHEDECVRRSTGLADDQLHTYNVVRQKRLTWEDVHGVDALILGGSGDHSATQDYPFSGWMAHLVTDAVSAGTPVFGICWGHHFLARALGGEVVTDPQREEIGTFDIDLTEEGRQDPLFNTMSPTFAANLVHHDSVSVLPPGCVELASSRACRYQTIRLQGKPVVGTQFHGEMDKPQLSYRLGLYQDEYLHDMDQARAVIDGLRSTPEAGKVLRHFLDLYT